MNEVDNENYLPIDPERDTKNIPPCDSHEPHQHLRDAPLRATAVCVEKAG